MIVAALAAALLFPSPAAAKAKAGCKTHGCFERVAIRKCSQLRPRWCVERAIVTYRLKGWQAAWMRRIPHCESGWNPHAYYPSQVAETVAERGWALAHDRSSGLFAFKPGTWAGTPYGRAGRSVWRAKWNALAAAWMVRVGRAPGEWSCR